MRSFLLFISTKVSPCPGFAHSDQRFQIPYLNRQRIMVDGSFYSIQPVLSLPYFRIFWLIIQPSTDEGHDSVSLLPHLSL